MTYSTVASSFDFSSLTHDHLGDTDKDGSTIAIMRRHPMYDCLLLVKKYRHCLNGYSLEFPSTDIESTIYGDQEDKQLDGKSKSCARRKLNLRVVDVDDPMMYESSCTEQQKLNPLLVHVPFNGLLDRLKNYTQSGLAVDSRVYAFAMGLKTAERFLTTSSMKEIQETPS